MSLDEPFPLSQFSPRLQCAIRNEFEGRCPNLQEVAKITDAQWLSTPSIGPAILKKIRALGQCDECSIGQMTDAELLQRLIDLQEEIRLIQRMVGMTIPQSSREGRPRYRSLAASSDRIARSEQYVRTGRSVVGQGIFTSGPL